MAAEDVAAAAEAGQRPNWSVGIHPGDFLVPVCHQGMNRSQVMRLALTGVVSELDRQLGQTPQSSATPWVSRAHGAVSGCDAHSAYRHLNEENFYSYLFDEGDMFVPGYDPFADDNPQQGPLQRGFVQTFGEHKQPRIGEEMARPLKLNPTSEYTTPREFQDIGANREKTHMWFNQWVFAPIESILGEHLGQPDAPVDQLTLPPDGTKRRIFFAFARAVPGIIERLLEARGAHNSVVVSLQYDDLMNHELRHCAGKTQDELEAKMREVHLKAYNMYTSLLHADPSPGPEPIPAPVLEPEPEQRAGGAAAEGGGGGGAAPVAGGLAGQLAEMGVSSDVASHLESSTYFKMTASGRGTASRSEPERLNTYRAGEMLRQVSAAPVRLRDGQEYYEVQSPLHPEDRGLVPVAHCSGLDDGDLIQLAFSLQDPEEGHFPADETKQEFYAWAASKGIEHAVALSALDRQISKGGEFTGQPVHDAKTSLRRVQAEERQRAEAAAIGTSSVTHLV